MASELVRLTARRRLAGVSFVLSALTIVGAGLVPGSATGSLPQLTLWTLAAVSLLVACLLTANTLRGPKTGVTLLGCLLVALGVLGFVALRLGPQWIGRLYVEPAGVTGGPLSTQAFLEAGSGMFVYALPVLLIGGLVLAVGLDRTFVSTWYAGATWFVAVACYGLVAGVYWAEAVTAGSIALALLVLGVDIARFRPDFAPVAQAGPSAVTQ